jgi:hypothetical protein
MPGPALAWHAYPPGEVVLIRTLLSRAAAAVAGATLVLLAAAAPASAAAGLMAVPSLNGVLSSLTGWLVGILAALATLFLTIGGIRYLTAGGDPMQVERAKTALKSAAIGYALAALAPLLVSILKSVVGG